MSAHKLAEQKRLQDRNSGRAPWELWGPYLSERQWGTVREDYSNDGDAWNYFPFEQSSQKAYRWGEDGILGISDINNYICFAPVFWNGRDCRLKERFFGLSNQQGNHGEDVKELYFFLNNTPTHSYMRARYKYPQAAFPYDELIRENHKRNRQNPEYELEDTGVFDNHRYFDIDVEYAKNAPDDLWIRFTIHNRAPETAEIHLLPTLWFRNTWSWYRHPPKRPHAKLVNSTQLQASTPELPDYYLTAEEPGAWMFTENESNKQSLYGAANDQPFVKDAFDQYLVHGRTDAINPKKEGTKASLHIRREIQPGASFSTHLRLSTNAAEGLDPVQADRILLRLRQDADDYYESLTPDLPNREKQVYRQALAGLLWNKKFYAYSVDKWLRGDAAMPPPPKGHSQGRNRFWKNLHAHDIISMPDAWEYPYFCAWDLMFQSVAFAQIDADTAKNQNLLLRDDRYTAPNAQMPSYEWSLSDSTPPVSAWATWRIYKIDYAQTGKRDLRYLKRAYHRLLLDYSWWCNRVDQTGDNVFEGGFLGLDNIGPFDRRHPLPDGSRVAQSDGTAWMAMYSLNMLNMAVELSKKDTTYLDMASKLFNDFLLLASSINNPGSNGYSLWDDEDGFYYDVLKHPDESTDFLKIRSITGIVPLFAIESFPMQGVGSIPLVNDRLTWFQKHRPHVLDGLHHLEHQRGKRTIISLVPPERLRRILTRLFDESEFLSPHGIRSLSKQYQDRPYIFDNGATRTALRYAPAESPAPMFGGNSNWRGPVWIPFNFLIIEALQKYGYAYGKSFKLPFPCNSAKEYTLWEISLLLQKRIVGLFLPSADGRRPFQGNTSLLSDNGDGSDLNLFHEYFDAETGKGLGASHQTGWTALVAKMVRQLHTYGHAQTTVNN